MIEEIVWWQNYVLPVMVVLAPALAVYMLRKELTALDFSKVNWPWKDQRINTWKQKGYPMKNYFAYLITGIICISTLMAIPTVNAVPSSGAATCEYYTHQAVVQVAGVVGVGDNELFSILPGCGQARSPSQVFVWTGQYSGPVVLGLTPPPTFTWTPGGFTGCTFTGLGQVDSQTAAGSSSAAQALITMTSNECRGVIQFTVIIMQAAIYRWVSIIPINIIVPSQSEYNFLCQGTGTTANAVDPDASTCNNPELGGGSVNVTVNGTNVNIGLNVTGSGSGNVTEEPPGFNGSLYILLMVVVLCLARVSEVRNNQHLRTIAGFLALIAGYVVVWEMDRLGFNNVPGGFGWVLFYGILFHGWLGIHLMWPRAEQREV